MAAPVFILRLSGGQAIPLADGARLTRAEVPTADSSSSVAQVVRNPKDPSAWGLKNLTSRPWTAILNTGEQRRVEAGRTLLLMAGMRIDFGLVQGEIQAGVSTARRRAAGSRNSGRTRSKRRPWMVALLLLVMGIAGAAVWFSGHWPGGLHALLQRALLQGAAAQTQSAHSAEVIEAVPELSDLATLAKLHAPPVTVAVGPEAATVPLDDGVSVIVPAGAFPSRSKLTAVTVDVDLPRVDANVKSARCYVLSTADSFDHLGAPVVLEVPHPSASTAVAERVGNNWQAAPVPAGATTRVEITHFTKRLFGVVEWVRAAWAEHEAATVRRLIPKLDLEHPTPPDRPMVEGIENQDRWTRAFFGVGEHASRTPEQYCSEFKSMLRRYRAESNRQMPGDEPHLALWGFFFPAVAPSTIGNSHEAYGDSAWYWDKVSPSMETIDKESARLSQGGPISPAQFLEICIKANGDNVPSGVLAAHNFLKSYTYRGRTAYAEYLEELEQAGSDEAKQQEALQKMKGEMEKYYGPVAARLQPWRQDPIAPLEYYDKMGPEYHVFAAMATGVWGSRAYSLGAINFETFLRAFYFGDDKPDEFKGQVDECGYDIASYINRGMPDEDSDPQPRYDLYTGTLHALGTQRVTDPEYDGKPIVILVHVKDGAVSVSRFAIIQAYYNTPADAGGGRGMVGETYEQTTYKISDVWSSSTHKTLQPKFQHEPMPGDAQFNGTLRRRSAGSIEFEIQATLLQKNVAESPEETPSGEYKQAIDQALQKVGPTP